MEPKVLVISRDSWNETNNVGNTLSNLFQNWHSDRIANLYCRDEIPNNKVCTHYFKISESLLVKKLMRKVTTAGIRVERKIGEYNLTDQEAVNNEKKEKRLYDFFRNNRWHIFLWGRELLWKTGIWKSGELKKFLTDFNPDIIFSQSYDSFYMHDLLQYAKKNTNAKVVFFHCDDLVTYRQYSLSPFYWINRLILRYKMSISIKDSAKNYCIIDEQARVYKEIFNIDFELLYKTGNFIEFPKARTPNLPLKMVYTGNVIYGRIDSIIKVAEILEEINKEGFKVILYLYTANPISEEMKSKLLNTGSVKLMGKVAYNEIHEILAGSDILLHVESFEKKQMFATSLSFSTKLVDYFEAAKPILAMGWKKAASVMYLNDNEIGLSVNNEEELYLGLKKLVTTRDFRNSLGLRAWEFGKLHHEKNIVLRNFERDLFNLAANKI